MITSVWTILSAMILVCTSWRRVDASPTRSPICHCLKTDVKLVDVKLGICSCWPCPTCEEGQGLSVLCNATVSVGTDIECLACELGKNFSEHRGTEQCKSCTKCQENEVVLEECRPFKDTVCGGCKDGYYRSNDTARCLPNCGKGELCPQPTPKSSTRAVFTTEEITELSVRTREQPTSSLTYDSHGSEKRSSIPPQKDRGIMELDQSGKRAGLIVTIILALILLSMVMAYIKRRLCGTMASNRAFLLCHSETEHLRGPPREQLGPRPGPNRVEMSSLAQLQEPDGPKACCPHAGREQNTDADNKGSHSIRTEVVKKTLVCGVYSDTHTWPSLGPPSYPAIGKMTQRARKVNEIPWEPWLKKICNLLDTKRWSDCKDFRKLGEEIGLDKSTTNFLDSQRDFRSPTQVILLERYATQKNATVGRLGQILYRIGRSDVAEVIDDWVDSETKKYVFVARSACNV